MLVITTLDRLTRSTANMLALAEHLRAREATLRMLNLGGASMDTSTATSAMIFNIMAALAQMDLEIKCERISDSVTKRRAASKDLGGRRPQYTDSQIHNAPPRVITTGQPASQVAHDLGMSRATLYRRVASLSAT